MSVKAGQSPRADLLCALQIYLLLLFLRVLLSWFPAFNWERQPWLGLRQVWSSTYRGIHDEGPHVLTPFQPLITVALLGRSFHHA